MYHTKRVLNIIIMLNKAIVTIYNIVYNKFILSMPIDLNVNTKYSEIINSMDNINRLTLQGIMNIVDSYEKQHKSYKKKLEILFTLLLTKHVDIVSQNNPSHFLDNLKIVLM